MACKPSDATFKVHISPHNVYVIVLSQKQTISMVTICLTYYLTFEQFIHVYNLETVFFIPGMFRAYVSLNSLGFM